MILHTKTDQEILDCIEAQKKYCEETGAPHFAPKDGVCWRCGRHIYQFYGHEGGGWRERKKMRVKWKEWGTITCRDGEEYERITGYTNEEAATKLVTGCPHCNRTFCD